MGPLINLATGMVVVILAFILFRPRSGWFWRWRQRPEELVRIQMEDALKHFYHHHEQGLPGTIESLAGALQVSCDKAAHVAERLEQRALVTRPGVGFGLTEAGRLYALQVIRTHRLWEHYLANETGVAEQKWHGRADQVEHHLSREEVDELSRRLGNPVFDPHGDPIPTAEGEVRLPEGQPLHTATSGSVVRVVHIEDEPESTYRELLAARLEPGMTLGVIQADERGVELDTGGQRQQLSSALAANVTVVPLAEAAAERLALRRLSALTIGQQAVVESISPACRGMERRRLLDLGLVPGTRVVAEFASPAGDPVAYRVRGALIALRTQQADMIHIQPDTN